MSVLRVYAPEECGEDGYPFYWHSVDGGPGIKHMIRAARGGRCQRCHHPYETKMGEWSRCDAECDHAGPFRVIVPGHRDVIVHTGPMADHLVEAGRVDAQWRILTVHHLTGVKADCRWWNLTALCQRCHLYIQRKVRMDQVFPYEHTEWFKPHAAGYYASVYLGLDLTEPETLARLDELLALERSA